ncbi:MAG: response regulator, partial [Deltaproteobacteria bacterium]|nr:response regulator [Deltaproteobacteria bacterium]
MKVQNKISILLVLITALFLAGLLFLQFYTVYSNRVLLENNIQDKINFFEKTLQLEGSSLDIFSFNYSKRNELLHAVNTGDAAPLLKSINIDLPSFNVGAIWLYRSDFSLVLHHNLLQTTTLDTFPLKKDNLEQLFLRGSFYRHFFLPTVGGLLEVRTAPVQPEWSDAPRAILFACRLWNPEYTKILTSFTESALEVTDVTVGETITPYYDPMAGDIHFTKVLLGWDRSPVALIKVTYASTLIKEFKHASQLQSTLLIIFAVTIVTIFSFFTLRWIRTPLRQLSQALSENSSLTIAELQKNTTEFGNLARLISAFFQQKETLEIEIKERLIAESELKKHRDRLDELVTERTAALNKTNDQLRQEISERKLAEQRENALRLEADKANQAKSDFLANMSHEIRTPMNGVIGMTTLLLTTELNTQQSTYANAIKGSAASLLTIINDILDFSKIEADKLELETLRFDLRTTLEDLNDSCALRAFDAGLTYSCLIEHTVPSLLYGDPGRLRQILTNLIGNALKFTPKGEIMLRVSIKNETDNDAQIAFEVKDTGIGIPEDQIGRLFDKFTQVDPSTTRKYGGTGLGLAITKKLAEMLGGQIFVKSTVGKGSQFTLSINLRKQTDSNIASPPELIEITNTPVLIVDNNQTSRHALKEQLLVLQCRVTEAAHGTTAIRKLKETGPKLGTPHIVIMPAMLPDMSAAELGITIKADPVLADTKLVLATDIGERGDARRYREGGFSAYLVKPIKQHLLQ